MKPLFGRECKCGCGKIVGGRQQYATNACRQRAYRRRGRAAAWEAYLQRQRYLSRPRRSKRNAKI